MRAAYFIAIFVTIVIVLAAMALWATGRIPHSTVPANLELSDQAHEANLQLLQALASTATASPTAEEKADTINSLHSATPKPSEGQKVDVLRSLRTPQ